MRYIADPVLAALAARKMALIAGPRQVGKTTYARSLVGEAQDAYFNWDSETHRRRILRAPEVVGRASDPQFALAAEAAIRAIKLTVPFDMPADKYAAWQENTVEFDVSKTGEVAGTDGA